MPPTRSLLSGPSLEGLRTRATRELGPGARIVSAQKVTVGGVAGLFARSHYEVVVEVPDEPVARVTITPSSRSGIAALLADAEEAEEELQRRDLPDVDDTRRAIRRTWSVARDGEAEPFGAPGSHPEPGAPDDVPPPAVAPVDPPASAPPGGRRGARVVRDDAFASVMDDLAFNGLVRGPAPVARRGAAPSPAPRTAGGAPAPAAPGPTDEAVAPGASGPLVAPPVARAPGDLVVVVGRAADAFAVAASMTSAHGLRSVDVDDRRSAILARATGVHEGAAVVTALAWSSSTVDVLAAVQPDQVWVAVDVGRKHEDTAAWVDVVRRVVPVAAAVVVGATETATPGTVHLLGLPVGRPFG
ncbi:hypothetical protein [Frigoribacterium salinisoli]